MRPMSTGLFMGVRKSYNGDSQASAEAFLDAINPLLEGDSTELAEDERTAWLALYEGARCALKHEVALTLAG